MNKGVGYSLFGAGVMGVAAVVTFAVVPTLTGGHPSAPESAKAGTDRVLVSLPEQPGKKWEADVTTLFGTSAKVAEARLQDATDKLVVVTAFTQDHRPGPVMAVDPANGHPLWKAPGPGSSAKCAISDDKVACLQWQDEDSAPSTSIVLYDAATGKQVADTTVDVPQADSIVRAGNGFAVWSTEYHEDTNTTDVKLGWVSSDGSRKWARKSGDDQDEIAVSAAGGVIVARDGDRSASVYRLDTGATLYDSAAQGAGLGAAENAKEGFAITRVGVIPHADGFAVSLGGTDHALTRFFDRNGVAQGDADGITLPDDADGTDGTVLPFYRQHGTAFSVGAVSAADHKVVWEKPSNPDNVDDVMLLAGKFLMAGTYYDDFRRWQVYSLSDGTPRGTITTGRYQAVEGTDGERIIVSGNHDFDDQGPGAFTAFDSATGKQLWLVKPPGTAGEARLDVIGPYLFQTNVDRNNKEPSSILRYG